MSALRIAFGACITISCNSCGGIESAVSVCAISDRAQDKADIVIIIDFIELMLTISRCKVNRSPYYRLQHLSKSDNRSKYFFADGSDVSELYSETMLCL